MPQTIERLQYPTVTEMRALDPLNLETLEASEPIFRHFPIRQSQFGSTLTWTVRDTSFGLQHARAYNTPFPKVDRVGAQEFTIRSGQYGEHVPVEEREITERMSWGGSSPIPIDDIVQEALRITQIRQVGRQAHSCWTLAGTGRHAITNEFGTVIDEYFFDIIEMDGSDWTNHATATPFDDLLDVTEVPLGTTVSFAGGIAYANRVTANHATRNTNDDDLGGKRAADGSTLTGLEDANRVFSRNSLPTLVAHDGGYWDESGWHKYIPDNKVIIFGSVPGGEIGEYRMTRNGNNPDRSSRPYLKVIDTGVDPQAPPPRRIEVYRGHAGAPIVWHPSAIVVLNVGP